jgi:hypothetical protein
MPFSSQVPPSRGGSLLFCELRIGNCLIAAAEVNI